MGGISGLTLTVKTTEGSAIVVSRLQSTAFEIVGKSVPQHGARLVWGDETILGGSPALRGYPCPVERP